MENNLVYETVSDFRTLANLRSVENNQQKLAFKNIQKIENRKTETSGICDMRRRLCMRISVWM